MVQAETDLDLEVMQHGQPAVAAAQVLLAATALDIEVPVVPVDLVSCGHLTPHIMVAVVVAALIGSLVAAVPVVQAVAALAATVAAVTDLLQVVMVRSTLAVVPVAEVSMLILVALVQAADQV